MGKRTTGLGASLVTVALLTACGAADQTTFGAREVDAPTTTVVSDVTDETGTDPTGSPDAKCAEVEQRTLETAVEAFFAENGRLPADALELFEDGFLRVEYTGFEIDSDGTVVRAPDHPCSDIPVEPDIAVEEPPATTAPTSLGNDDFPMDVDEWLDILGDDVVAALGGPACATEVAAIVVAALEYGGIDSPDPESLEVLAPYLDRPIELWTLEPGDETPQPVPGSGCSTAGFDLSVDLPEPTAEERCRVERRTFETAVEVFALDEGDDRPPTEDELVGTYIRDPFEHWDLDDWTVVPVPGSPCEDVVRLDCEIERLSMIMDLERYAQQTGSDEPSSERELAAYSDVSEYEHWDLDGSDVVPAPGSICPDR